MKWEKSMKFTWMTLVFLKICHYNNGFEDRRFRFYPSMCWLIRRRPYWTSVCLEQPSMWNLMGFDDFAVTAVYRDTYVTAENKNHRAFYSSSSRRFEDMSLISLYKPTTFPLNVLFHTKNNYNFWKLHTLHFWDFCQAKCLSLLHFDWWMVGSPFCFLVSLTDIMCMLRNDWLFLVG